MAKIDKRLNLVYTITLEDGQLAYVHSTPIRREIFEANYLVLAKAYSHLYTNGLNFLAGPRVAMLALRDVAEREGRKDEIERNLIAEMHRLTNVLVATPQGYQTMMYDEAVSKDIIDLEAKGELDNALAFFTLVSAVAGQKGSDGALEGMSALWGTRITQFTFTDFRASLPTLTATETLPPQDVVSVPS